MWQTLEEFKEQIDEYFEVNGEYPRKIQCSLKWYKPKGFRAYCNRMKIKVNYA